ncbi:MAG TPA: glycosidase [Thermoanaerobaculia bacterium]|nr:glycosidase [Thermoanaerobaculia bacterium]
MTHFETLFQRNHSNPILEASDWPYPVHTVFNAGATLLPDGTTLLLCRVEDRRGHSHLCAARSADGVGGWVIDAEPTMRADPEKHPEELWGVEDPRITFVPELGKYAIAYTAFGRGGPGVSLALTTDFIEFERCGLVMQPDDKDAALLPRRIGGMYALVHRPIADSGAHVWISYSPDLRNWGNHQMMLPARRGGWWDANKVGLSPPLIETDRGWLMLYHGVRSNAAGSLYRLGVALFDLDDPSRLLLRGDEWIFGPEALYETTGDVNNVTFPCGYTVGPDGDRLNLYYGAADTCIALATGSISGILKWLDKHGSA